MPTFPTAPLSGATPPGPRPSARSGRRVGTVGGPALRQAVGAVGNVAKVCLKMYLLG